MGRPLAKIKKVKVVQFKTTDGELHDTPDDAFEHQEMVDQTDKFNEFTKIVKKNNDLTEEQAENFLDLLCENYAEFREIFLQG